MLVSLMTIAMAVSGDPAAAQASKPAPQRLEMNRFYQWMFGKRHPAPKTRATEPTAEKAPMTADLSDARVELRCRSNVFNEPELRGSGMTVRVTDGVAYLEGASASRWLRLRAEQLAAKTPGVSRVENNLKIEGGADQVPAEPLPRIVPEAESLKAASHVGSGSESLVSRPKTLATEGGDPVVTTYTIRRAKTGNAPVKSAASAMPNTAKPGAGKLVRWGELESIKALGDDVSDDSRDVSSEDSIDSAIGRLIAESPNARNMTFERKGKSVTLKGTAAPAVLFALGQKIGRVPGVATVTFDGK